jgi:hypothetical protein
MAKRTVSVLNKKTGRMRSVAKKSSATYKPSYMQKGKLVENPIITGFFIRNKVLYNYIAFGRGKGGIIPKPQMTKSNPQQYVPAACKVTSDVGQVIWYNGFILMGSRQFISKESNFIASAKSKNGGYAGKLV